MICACIYVAIFLAQSLLDNTILIEVSGRTFLSKAMAGGSSEAVAPAYWMQEGLKRGEEGDHALAPVPNVGRTVDKEEKKGDLYEDLIKLVAQRRLSDARELAAAAGTVFQTWKLFENDDTEGPTILIGVGVKYDEDLRSLKEEQQNGEVVKSTARGPPHARAWGALCLWHVNNAAEFEGRYVYKESEATVVQDHFQKHTATKSPTESAKHEIHFRYRKFKRKQDQDQEPLEGGKKGKLMLAFSYDDLGKEARKLLLQYQNNESFLKDTQLVGIDPQNPLEGAASHILSLIEKSTPSQDA